MKLNARLIELFKQYTPAKHDEFVDSAELKIREDFGYWIDRQVHPIETRPKSAKMMAASLALFRYVDQHHRYDEQDWVSPALRTWLDKYFFENLFYLRTGIDYGALPQDGDELPDDDGPQPRNAYMENKKRVLEMKAKVDAWFDYLTDGNPFQSTHVVVSSFMRNPISKWSKGFQSGLQLDDGTMDPEALYQEVLRKLRTSIRVPTRNRNIYRHALLLFPNGAADILGFMTERRIQADLLPRLRDQCKGLLVFHADPIAKRGQRMRIRYFDMNLGEVDLTRDVVNEDGEKVKEKRNFREITKRPTIEFLNHFFDECWIGNSRNGQRISFDRTESNLANYSASLLDGFLGDIVPGEKNWSFTRDSNRFTFSFQTPVLILAKPPPNAAKRMAG